MSLVWDKESRAKHRKVDIFVVMLALQRFQDLWVFWMGLGSRLKVVSSLVQMLLPGRF